MENVQLGPLRPLGCLAHFKALPKGWQYCHANPLRGPTQGPSMWKVNTLNPGVESPPPASLHRRLGGTLTSTVWKPKPSTGVPPPAPPWAG